MKKKGHTPDSIPNISFFIHVSQVGISPTQSFVFVTKIFSFFTYPVELERWTHSVELVVVGEYICEQDGIDESIKYFTRVVARNDGSFGSSTECIQAASYLRVAHSKRSVQVLSPVAGQQDERKRN